MYTLLGLESKTFGELKKIGYELNVLPAGDRRYRQSWIDAIAGVNPPLLQLLEVSPGVEVDRVQKPIIETVETSPAAEAEQVQELPIESKFSRIVYPRPAQEVIAQVVKIPPGVKTEPKLSQSAIAPASKNYLEDESDQNPILTGIALSDRFVARYSPPQPEIIHFKPDADGQLSLLDFEVQSVNEPPDPDDYDSMFAFWAAYDAWDKATDDDSEPLEVSLDSFSEWAPCPDDWYEPSNMSEVSELSPTKSFSTSDFFIPIFDAWCDRSNKSDEPPDTGIFARLPKPKPPKFPPQAASQQPVNQASRYYSDTISPRRRWQQYLAGPIASGR